MKDTLAEELYNTSRLTIAALDVLDADDMTAACDIQTGHNAFFGVDSVRQAMHCIVVLVNVREDVAADRACEDAV
jgi:hypothetical protein